MNATLPRDLASPQACAARQARIAAWNQAEIARAKELSDAMAVFRKHGIRNPLEFKAALECVRAACTGNGDHIVEKYAEQVTDICCDLEGELYGIGLELSAIRSMEAV